MSEAVLFVCTGNQCRSPMAAALLTSGLTGRQHVLTASSAGFVSEDAPSPPEVVEVMAELGLDLSGHRSHVVTDQELQATHLVVAMTRQHLIDLTVAAPAGWERFFTFADLLRRAGQVGPRRPAETLGRYVTRLNGARARSEALALSMSEDVADPIGGRLEDYARTRDELGLMTRQLADALVPA